MHKIFNSCRLPQTSMLISGTSEATRFDSTPLHRTDLEMTNVEHTLKINITVELGTSRDPHFLLVKTVTLLKQ